MSSTQPTPPTTPQSPAYEPGDEANGYRLSADGTWKAIPMAPLPAPPKRSLWRRGWVRGIGIGVLAFTLGVLGSAGGQPEPETRTVTNTVTKTVEVPVEVPVNVEVPVVPPESLTALDQADQVVAALNYIIDWTQRYLTAASEFDVEEMTALTDELDATVAGGEFSGVIPAYEQTAAKVRELAK